jgi:hypothetical protein
MFDQQQKILALEFARSLAKRDYRQAYNMLSLNAQSQLTEDALREQFESMIPPDWGDVDPIELEENPAWDEMLLYVVLGGDEYSEAIIVNSFASENELPKIDSFQFGRP